MTFALPVLLGGALFLAVHLFAGTLGVAGLGLILFALELFHDLRRYRKKEDPSVLTPRELAALTAYAQLGDYALAAGELGIALSTVKNHIHRAYRKLDTTNSLGAMKALGWLEVPR